ncbi:MAG: PepSY-associated TM helix domain-containing protein [Bacteroidota bacterium]|nr:PepSY-associated TM helix domain-containing protein [Bacteroidota bacterium]MDP4253088.1 PepSY-associated TM helix domain-containing protein [Bacteroidota bacterium]
MIGKPGHTVWKRRGAMLTRWLHIYLSMISFVIVFFFSVTGLTLNHADRFGDQVRSVQEKGRLNPRWIDAKDSMKIDRLDIVEFLRNKYSIHAALSDFRIDDAQVGVSFKGPGFAADVFIDRGNGDFDITQTSAGFVGLINDLHKGRDTGHAWSVFIDVAAILMALVSLTGLLLLLFLKRRRRSGLLVAAAGLFMAYLVYLIWIK